ncbi:MAG: SDR family oxidoreductase, partial [Gemmataceae bacterium]
MNGFTNQVVLITGAGSGVGRAIAIAFAAAGAKVALNGRDAAKLQEVQSVIGAENCLVCPGDVGDPLACQQMVQQTTERFGRVDILVNNAGGNIKERSLRELTPESWAKLIDANLNGAFYCLHAVLPQMLERNQGYIINIVSVAGKRANPLAGAAYVASKFGMGGLGMCLSNEERESGVRVSNIYPGEIDTP